MGGFNRAKNSAAAPQGNIQTAAQNASGGLYLRSSYVTRHGGLVHFGKAISGNIYKDNGGTILFAGNVNTGGLRPTVSNILTLSTDQFISGRISGRIYFPTGLGGDSGNIGTSNPLSEGSQGRAGLNSKGNYIAMVVNKYIAGSSSTLLSTTGADFGTRKKGLTLTPTPKFQLLSISSWNMETGQPTYSGLQGTTTTFLYDSGVAGPGTANPGNYPPFLSYMQGGLIPFTTGYKLRTNW